LELKEGHYCVYMAPPLRKVNAVHNITPYFFSTPYDLILPSTSIPRCFSPSCLPTELLYAFLVSPVLTTRTQTTVFWLSKQRRFISTRIHSFSTWTAMATGTCRAGFLFCVVIRVICRVHSRYYAPEQPYLMWRPCLHVSMPKPPTWLTFSRNCCEIPTVRHSIWQGLTN
jgi:hypothetical protein